MGLQGRTQNRSQNCCWPSAGLHELGPLRSGPLACLLVMLFRACTDVELKTQSSILKMDGCSFLVCFDFHFYTPQAKVIKSKNRFRCYILFFSSSLIGLIMLSCFLLCLTVLFLMFYLYPKICQWFVRFRAPTIIIFQTFTSIHLPVVNFGPTAVSKKKVFNSRHFFCEFPKIFVSMFLELGQIYKVN